jgi:hypothetical protein
MFADKGVWEPFLFQKAAPSVAFKICPIVRKKKQRHNLRKETNARCPGRIRVCQFAIISCRHTTTIRPKTFFVDVAMFVV